MGQWPPATFKPWRTVRKGGDPKTDQEGTTRTPGWHPEENATQLQTVGEEARSHEPVWNASASQGSADSLFPLKVPRIQFLGKVLNLPVVLRRRGTHNVTVQKTDEFPQMRFLDQLKTSVVVQRLVPGRVSADNCGGSAVAWGLFGDSAGAVLGQV